METHEILNHFNKIKENQKLLDSKNKENENYIKEIEFYFLNLLKTTKKETLEKSLNKENLSDNLKVSREVFNLKDKKEIIEKPELSHSTNNLNQNKKDSKTPKTNSELKSNLSEKKKTKMEPICFSKKVDTQTNRQMERPIEDHQTRIIECEIKLKREIQLKKSISEKTNEKTEDLEESLNRKENLLESEKDSKEKNKTIDQLSLNHSKNIDLASTNSNPNSPIPQTNLIEIEESDCPNKKIFPKNKNKKLNTSHLTSGNKQTVNSKQDGEIEEKKEPKKNIGKIKNLQNFEQKIPPNETKNKQTLQRPIGKLNPPKFLENTQKDKTNEERSKAVGRVEINDKFKKATLNEKLTHKPQIDMIKADIHKYSFPETRNQSTFSPFR